MTIESKHLDRLRILILRLAVRGLSFFWDGKNGNHIATYMALITLMPKHLGRFLTLARFAECSDHRFVHFESS